MKVLLAATSLAPAYGGPAVSVFQLARALAGAGVEVGLWAADGSAEGLPLPGGCALGGSPEQALAAFGAPDVLHDSGIWLPHNHRLAALATRRGLPRIVSPRGMLEPWARRHKGWKKALAWRLYQRADLRGAALLHATSEPEARNLEALGLGVPVGVVPNGVEVPEGGSRPPEGRGAAGPRTVLFLGRIYPVKGLPMLVEAWARARPKGWRLVIAGPDEAGHRAEVESDVAAAGLQGEVSFLGPVAGEAKTAALFGADLFVLPSHSESFGMAIGEALAHGLPVLTTTAAPWPLLEARACGWRVAPDPGALAEGLRRATALGPAQLRAMGQAGREAVAEAFGWAGVANRFVTIYQQTTAGGLSPPAMGRAA
jgi:glycosyltransferase involved in cell wall biosynthesis